MGPPGGRPAAPGKGDDVAQAHLDRLTSIDAGFLHQEDGGAHMHIGGLGVFEGPAPTGEQFRDHLESRLPLVPRYRQRLVEMPLGTGRPLWADDPAFRIGYHVRHTALPSPGGEAELLTLVSRILSQRLDRTKPLWEIWIVEGLEGDRWALVGKTHHAMIDGVGGVDLLTALLDLTPETTDGPGRRLAAPAHAGRRRPGRRGSPLRADGRRWASRARGLSLALHPERAVREGLETAAALAAAAQPLLDGAPKTPLNGTPGPHRTGRRRADPARGLQGGQEGHRRHGERRRAGRRGRRARPLPRRPRHRRRRPAAAGLRAGQRAHRGQERGGRQRDHDHDGAAAGRRHRPAAAAEAGARVHAAPQGVAPGRGGEGAHRRRERAPARRAGARLAARLQQPDVQPAGHQRAGPAAADLPDGPPAAGAGAAGVPRPEHHLAIAIISYDGAVTYGLLADADALPDLDELAAHLEESLAELVRAAGA
jgi:hypothetical protein